MGTIAAITATVGRNLSGRSDLGSQIADGITFALEDIGKRHHWNGLMSQSTVTIEVDDANVTLPTGSDEVFKAVLIDGLSSFPMLVIPKNRFLELYPSVDDAASGTPEIGYVENGTFYFSPKSSGDFSISFSIYTYPAVGTSPSIGGLDGVIVAGATAFVFASLERWESEAKWTTLYERRLAAAIRSDRKRPAQSNTMEASTPEAPLKGNFYDDPFVRRNP